MRYRGQPWRELGQAVSGRRGEFEEIWWKIKGHFDRTRRGGEGWRKLGEASCEATERQNGEGSER